jgi:peptide deformylase
VPVAPIVITGHPNLHRPAHRVSAITDDIVALVDTLTDTMHAAPGVGLAAPQIGVGLQVFVWHFDDGENLHKGHVINPHLAVSRTPLSWPGKDPEEEGCLSVPGLRAPLARHGAAHLTGIDCDGRPVHVSASGWLARIFQHEYDHLRGILYVDRLGRRLRKNLLAEARDAGLGTTLTAWTPGVDGEESDFITESH